MKATDILKPYRKAAPALGYRANAWITLLTLCDAGPEGLSKADLMNHYAVRGDGSATALKRWERAGLLTVHSAKAKGNRGGRSRHFYVATEKLHQFLRIESV
jgi:hypothetical protein